jgi:CrcB protein
MVRVLLIGIGGFVGSILRYWISGLAQDVAAQGAFPIGTLMVNVVGCLAIGVLSELAEARGFLTSDTRAFLIVGLLGGFTTFSTFANETVGTLRDGAYPLALANVAASVGLCLAAVWAGRSLAYYIWR